MRVASFGVFAAVDESAWRKAHANVRHTERSSSTPHGDAVSAAACRDSSCCGLFGWSG